MSGVTAVVPSYNRRDLLERLLPLLRAQTRPPEEILVVDNASTDGSAEAAAALGARVLRMERNTGFACAVNHGVRASRTEWLALVNNDVEPAPDWLEKLLDGASERQAWFATGKLLDAARRDVIDGTFDALSRGACAWRCGAGRPDGPLWSEPRPIRFAPLTAALVRRELFDRVGLLDEEFESYLEDAEFGLRCALADYQGFYLPSAVAWHASSATLGAWHPRKVRRIARNQLLLAARHYPLRRYLWPMLIGQMLWVLVAWRHGALGACLAGKLEGLRMFGRARRPCDVQAVRRILAESEEEILHGQRTAGYDLYWRLYFALT
jgi:GT2 family glycosyltransferase